MVSRLISSCPISALVYNGVNSSIDAARGKHDILGSMAAGAVTGALYKSTGLLFCSTRVEHLFLTFHAFVSGGQASHSSGNSYLRIGGHLELRQEECLM